MTMELVVAQPVDLEYSARGEAVLVKIKELRDSITSNFFELGNLLLEVKENNYHIIKGYTRFTDYVEAEDGIGVGARDAYNFVRIVSEARRLDIPESDLKAVKISALKEIFSLRDQPKEVITTLLEKAKECKLEETKLDVQRIKVADSGEPFVTKSIKLPLSVWESVVPIAVEKARAEHGTVEVEGEAQEISVSKVFEIALVDYINSDAHNDTIDVEFEDVDA